MLRLGLLAVASTAPAPAARAQDSKPGAHLIGKLEGPEVITDPAQFPKRFTRSAWMRKPYPGGLSMSWGNAPRRRPR
jgi:hypothetical protein